MTGKRRDDGQADLAATILFAARVEAGVSQRELAERAGTSGATIAAYELRTKEPRLSTLRRLLEAAGMSLKLAYEPAGPVVGLTREEARSLALHRAILVRLAADPATVLAKAHQNLATMRRANDDGSAEMWFSEWDRLLSGQVSGIVEALVSKEQHARDLRQVTPFAGVLSDDERRAIYRAQPAA